MNEETKNLEGAVTMDSAESLPADPDARPANGSESQETPAAADAPAAQDPGHPHSAPADAGADPGTGTADSPELSALRAELTHLRDELMRKQEVTLRLGKECAEFQDLYPDVPLSAIPDDAWDAVRSGVPLPAAFALSERKRVRLEETARQSNLQNHSRSTGHVSQTLPEYFSYDEVRRMSRAEIRENYDSILRSMQKWR